MKFALFACLAAISLTACEQLALWNTPKKQAEIAKDQGSILAENYFWTTLHQGDYQNIEKAIQLLMIAYLAHPNAPKLAAHLGFLHMWKITEHQREVLNPEIPDEIILAKKYFSDAIHLDPKNAIYEGFLGDAELVEGQIFQDKRQEVRGYFILQRAIAKWPQFNYFTAGYPLSTLAQDSQYFKEGLEWQWRTLDLCAKQKINRKNPDFSAFMYQETQVGAERACWNSWIAPYNFEGFFLNMGDMLVKSGDWQTAILIYQNAKLAKNYASWPFREMLEQRILSAQQNVTYFQDSKEIKHTILFNSGHGCTVCHQTRSLRKAVK